MSSESFHNRTNLLNLKPEHWQELKLRQILRPFSEKNHSNMPLLSVVRERGVIIRNIEDKEENHNFIPEDLSGYKLVKKGQFVINKMKAWQGSYGVSEYEGIVSPAYFVFDFNFKVNINFFNYAIRSKLYVNYFGQSSDGIRVGQWDLSLQKMKEIPFLLPTYSEQEQIVKFLDWKISSIEKLIIIRNKQINIVKDFLGTKIEKQLKKYPIVKKVRLKTLGKFEKGGGFSRDNLIEKNGLPAILYGDIYTQYTYFTSEISHQIDEEAYKNAPKIYNRDIIFAGTGETKDEIGKPILYSGEEIVAAGGDVIIFHPEKTMNEKYLLFQLYSQSSLNFRYINGKGDIIVHIYPKDLGDTLIPIIDINDQMKVVESITEALSKYNAIIDKLRKEIDVLKEYKDRLIVDVVTGKMDVRNIEMPDYIFEGERMVSDNII